MRYAIVSDGSMAVYSGGALPPGAIALSAEQYNGIINGELTISSGAVVHAIPLQKTSQEQAAELAATIEAAIDIYIDSVARAKGYGTVTMSPTAACVSYAGYQNIYQQEAIAFGQWKADIWPVVNQIYADVTAGSRSIPTAAEVISELPVMVWP